MITTDHFRPDIGNGADPTAWPQIASADASERAAVAETGSAADLTTAETFVPAGAAEAAGSSRQIGDLKHDVSANLAPTLSPARRRLVEIGISRSSAPSEPSPPHNVQSIVCNR